MLLLRKEGKMHNLYSESGFNSEGTTPPQLTYINPVSCFLL